MNPMTNVKNIKKLSELELKQGNSKSSWHDQYRDSAWLFVGGLPYDLTEGDVICVFSQYGEVVNINLVRDKATGKSRGFCFLCYEDQRSTVLAVDNFNGIKLLGRTIRVDHVSDYKAPKDSDKLDDETRRLHAEGCAPKLIEEEEKEEVIFLKTVKKEKKDKPKLKVKKEKKHKKKKKKAKVEVSSSSSDSGSDSEPESSSDSDSDDRRKKRSKGKHSSKKNKKKPQNSASSSESSSEEEVKVSAKSKRQQLEEKIRVLEQALHSVKNASRKNHVDPKQKSSAKNVSDNERPSVSVSSSDRGEFKYRVDGERRNDSRDRSSRSDGHRSRESGGRNEDLNGTRHRDRSRERSRHEERGRDRDYSDVDKRKKYNGDHDKRQRDRSHDRYRR